MHQDFLSQQEVDSLLEGVVNDESYQITEDDWAEAMMAIDNNLENQMNTNDRAIVGEDGKSATFSIKCGDWVYPNKDSISSVQYPIEQPMVLMMFCPNQGDHNISVTGGGIDRHLSASRRLHCHVDLVTNILSLLRLTNDAEPDYERELATDYAYHFNPDTLARKNSFDLTAFGLTSNDWQRWSIFVTSVLLQSWMRSPDASDPTHKSWGTDILYFRPATIPEIEAIGRWYGNRERLRGTMH